MPAPSTVFLFDVDNTLLDHDRVTADLRRHLAASVGANQAQHYWVFFEDLRAELGYADYLGALQRYRLAYPHDPHLLTVSYYLIRYPFANRLFPNSLDVVDQATKLGTTVLLTDGDVVFQPHKIYRSGLYDAFEGRVLIYIHKELELDLIAQEYPADHYVMIDDKLRILTIMKQSWKDRLTTVFVRQGHYALDAKAIAQYPAADLTIDRIGDLFSTGLVNRLAAAAGAQPV